MAIRTREELMERVREYIGEDTTDKALSLIEDVNDTIADSDEWRTRYEQNDKEWREKYKARFFSDVEKKDEEPPDSEDEIEKTIDELFEESIEYFKECNFEITEITYDLHNSDIDGGPMTEHEKMFSEQGIKIKALIAKMRQVGQS